MVTPVEDAAVKLGASEHPVHTHEDYETEEPPPELPEERPATAIVNKAAYCSIQVTCFLVLVMVQSTAILLFKVVQVSGEYTFSVASSVALTEMCKLVLSICMHIYNVHKSGTPCFEGVTARLAMHYLALGTMYCVNNQLAFACHIFADPGTYSVFKSCAPYLIAIFLRGAGDGMNQLQWVAVVLLCIAIMNTQYQDRGGTSRLSGLAYIMLAVHVSITASASVWNQKVLKGSPVPLALQNCLLYTYGAVFALISYMILEPPLNELSWRAAADIHAAQAGEGGAMNGNVKLADGSAPAQKAFFEGYTPLAILLVLSQAFHGMAVAAVYKYADAIVKSFASSATMAILVLLSALLFSVPLTFHSLASVASILVITWMYMSIAVKLPKPKVMSLQQCVKRCLIAPDLLRNSPDKIELMPSNLHTR